MHSSLVPFHIVLLHLPVGVALAPLSKTVQLSRYVVQCLDHLLL